MPIRIRHLKNQRRGTELTYATIPIEEAKRGIDGKEVLDYMTHFYGPKISIKGYFQGNEGLFGRDIPLNEAIATFANNSRSTNALFFTKDRETSKVEVAGKKYKVAGSAEYLTLQKKGNRILIMPGPFLHGVTGDRLARESNEDSYDHLISILKEGLIGKGFDNSYKAKLEKRQAPQFCYSHPSERGGLTFGDRYCITLFQKEGYTGAYEEQDDFERANASYVQAIKKADPNNIFSLSIKIYDGATPEQREEKMEFYKRQITEKYGIPVRFFDSAKKRVFPQKKKLEQIVSGIVGIFGLVSSFFLLGSSVTGNAIGNLGKSSGSWLGIGLLLVGIAGALVYFRSKKR